MLSAPTLADLEDRTRGFIADPAGFRKEPAQRYRRVVVADGHAEAARRLGRGRPTEVFTGEAGPPRPLVFMFPGIGDQYQGMAEGLYRCFPVFRRELDRCLRLLETELATGLRSVLYPATPRPSGTSLAALFDQRDTTQKIHRTLIAQPLAFATQYALAQLLLSLGITPSAMVGYSLGEYVAACMVGVFTLEDVLRVIAMRAKLMDAVPEGAMLAVVAEPERLSRYTGDGLAIASLDGPSLTVLTGPAGAIEAAGRRLMDEGVATRRLATTHAFHSPMMEPIQGPLHEMLSAVPLRPPRTPFLSNVTGTWITDEEATDPGYWTGHGLRTVRFADDLNEMWKLSRPVPIEVGPGRTLTNLARQHPGHHGPVLRTLPGPFESRSDLESLLMTVGTLWATGLDVEIEEPAWEI
jgi:acyl transferase domain-containing protein